MPGGVRRKLLDSTVASRISDHTLTRRSLSPSTRWRARSLPLLAAA